MLVSALLLIKELIERLHVSRPARDTRLLDLNRFFEAGRIEVPPFLEKGLQPIEILGNSQYRIDPRRCRVPTCSWLMRVGEPRPTLPAASSA